MRNFIKIICSVVFSILFFSSNSFSEMVNKVKVIGNERIALESIIVFGDIKMGENYEAQDVNLLIKKLYETNFFSDIKIKIASGELVINVTENPIVNSIVFDGEKADKYVDALTPLLTLREKTSFVSTYVKSDINIVKEFYRHLGFYFAKINLNVEELSNNRVNLIYKIDKGEKAKIAKIYFLGEKKIKERKLRNIITSQENKFWKILAQSVYLNKSRIELDKRLLRNFYKNKGYYEVKIKSSNVEYSEGEGFVLTYNIDAGKRYKFGKISLNIDKALDENAFMSLEKEFDAIIGQYYSQKKITRVIEKVDELTELRELQFINHGITETLNNDVVEVVLNIYEGKKFTIERINISGNSVTNDSVIRSEMLVDEGDAFSEVLINKSINNLMARRIFGKVDHTISEGSSPDLKVLNVQVEEQATGELSAGAGIGTDGTSFMFTVSENNWLGKGINLSSALNLSEETISGNIYISDPNYRFTGNRVFGNFNLASSDYTLTSGYESSKTGFGIGTEFEQYKDIFISPSISASYEEIEVESSASNAIKKMDGNYSNIDFLYGITVDRRNQAFQTTSGYKTKFLQSIPLVMDSSALLNGFNASTYYSISDDLVTSVKFYARSIHGMSDDDVRLTSRLHIPAKRIRGFQSRRIGPKDGEDYIGGNYATALSIEGQLPNLLPEETKTDISLFMDAANLWHVDYSNDIDDSDKLRTSVGISANMYTTIGPLSLTIAEDLSKADTDKTETFNFRLGTSF